MAMVKLHELPADNTAHKVTVYLFNVSVGLIA
jgi:hypothetical protein